MFTISALIPDLFATGLSNHQIIVNRPRGYTPVSCSIDRGRIYLRYRTSSDSSRSDQWDTGVPVESLISDLVLGIELLVDEEQTAVTNNPATVTLRKSGGGGNTEPRKVKVKGSLVGSFAASKSRLILVPYRR